MFMSLCHHNTTGICLLSLVTPFVSRIHAQTKALQFVPGFKKKKYFPRCQTICFAAISHLITHYVYFKFRMK